MTTATIELDVLKFLLATSFDHIQEHPDKLDMDAVLAIAAAKQAITAADPVVVTAPVQQVQVPAVDSVPVAVAAAAPVVPAAPAPAEPVASQVTLPGPAATPAAVVAPDAAPPAPVAA